MSQVVRFEGKNGAYMLVEVDRLPTSDVEPVGDEDGPHKAATRLEDSVDSIRGAAQALLGAMAEMPRAPDEVVFEFSLSFGVEGGVIVAKGSAKAEASVSLTWKSPTSG